MNPGLKGNKIWKHSRPTKYFFRLWCTKFHYKAPRLLGNRIHLQDAEADSKEALLVGDLTDGQKYCHYRGEVPSGFLVVYVGTAFRRFVIPASYLSLPDFRVLMERVAEEFGYEQEGGLRIPCEEDEFEMIILRCSAKRHKKKVQKE